MNDINHVIEVGRLTKDAQVKYTSNGGAVLNYSIAVNRSRKNGDQWTDEANFFDVVSYGKLAEALAPCMTKGQQVAIDGYLKQDRWQQDGQTRSKIVIVAENIQLVGGKKEGGSEPKPATSADTYRPRATAGNQSQPPLFAPPADDYPEDIPF